MKNRILRAAIFTLFLFLAWLLLFFAYLGVSGVTPGAPLAFASVFAVAHAGEFALGALLALILLSFLPGRIWDVACVLLGAGVTVFLLINFFVYRQFRLHIDLAMLSMYFGSAGSDIFVFPTVMYVQAGLGVLAILLFSLSSWAAASRLGRPGAGRRLKKAYALILVFILVYHGVHGWARFNMYAPITAQVSSLPLAQPLSLNRTLKKMGFKPAADLPRAKVGALKYPLAPLRFNPPPKRLNLAVIMLDGWRYDCMNEEVSPEIYAFSRLAQRFQRHNSGANHTRHGVFSFFYGLPGLYWEGALVDRVSPALLGALLRAGYDTAVFGSSSLASPEFDQTVFVNVPGLDTVTEGETPERKDLEITRKFMRFMDERDKSTPFFTFLFYDSTHAYRYDPAVSPPKYLPEGGKNYLSSDKRGTQLAWNRYKNTVRFDDRLVGRVLERLRAENLLDDTVVVITSDHGEEFDDLGLGYVGHNGNFSPYQVHVPMLVYWPGRAPADHHHPTSHMDVAPTLLQGLFGCVSPPADYGIGANLFSPEPRGYFFLMGPSGSHGIQVGDRITVFPQIGPSFAVSATDYRPVDWRMPPELYRRILLDLARFKK